MEAAGWPVEPPARDRLEVGPRKHRRFTGPFGLLLFVCMFMPAVKGCGSDVYPLEMPWFWHPYLYGAVFAAGALGTSLRSVRMTTIALRVLGWLCLVGGFAVLVISPVLGAIEVGLGALLLGAIGTRGVSERRMAWTAIAIAGPSLLWFGLWSVADGALIGSYVSLGSSIFLLTGGLVWLSEL